MNFLKITIPCLKQANLDELSSPRTPKDKSDSPYGIQQQQPPSPARSSSSSSSGSYDLEDAMPNTTQEAGYKSATHSTQASGGEQELDVSVDFWISFAG